MHSAERLLTTAVCAATRQQALATSGRRQPSDEDHGKGAVGGTLVALDGAGLGAHGLMVGQGPEVLLSEFPWLQMCTR